MQGSPIPPTTLTPAQIAAAGGLLASNNLSDVAVAATSRTNLGLGTAATAAASSFLTVANNLSDVASAATSRTNLGVVGAFPLISDVLLGGNTAAVGAFLNLLAITLTGAGTFVIQASAQFYSASGQVEFMTAALCPNIGNMTTAYKAGDAAIGAAILGASNANSVFLRHTRTQVATTTYYLNAKSSAGGGGGAIALQLDNNSAAPATYLAASQIA